MSRDDDLFLSEPTALPAQTEASIDGACALCVRRGGEYDFGRACCMARFLQALPSRDMRRGWLARWRAQGVSASQLADVKQRLNRAVKESLIARSEAPM